MTINSMSWPKEIICDSNDAIREIVLARRCYFYDTSAFRNHASVSNRKLILQYIKQMQGIVIITKSVLLELCYPNSGFWEEHVKYLNEMAEMELKVLFINEEDIVELLQSCYNSTAQINLWLSYAVKCVKSRCSAIETILLQEHDLKKEVFVNCSGQDSLLGRRFFEKMRLNKKSGDNLGEELISVCFHMLTNMPESGNYKYIMLTDDKYAVRLLGKVKQNVMSSDAKKYISAHTSANLCWHMKNAGIITCKEEIIEILNGERGNEQITCCYSETYALFPEMQSVRCEVLAEQVMQGAVKIYM
ncbi:MAG: hypothetical protein IJZ53_13275 [Tyzzerella sp.]|nr:hypothetical protein [Tyzzerella sp.]